MPDEGAKISIKNWEAFLVESKVYFQSHYKGIFQNKDESELGDFERLRIIGTGNFGTCVAVSKSGRFYAMKILNKNYLVQHKQVESAYIEKRIMQSLQFPFTVRLFYFFMDESYLYFLMPLGVRGDLFDHLLEQKRFCEDLVRFYAAQITLAVEYLHHLAIAHRDLKPENIVVFSNGYIKLIDFGIAKIVTGRTYTFCGTPEYMAPELIRRRGYGRSVDWWGLGVLIYEMAVGRTPFAAPNHQTTYENIENMRISFPMWMSESQSDLITRLLERDITRRYGNLWAGANDIKNHEWFTSINWLAIFNQEVKAPTIPAARPISTIGKPYNAGNFRSKHVKGLTQIFQDF